MPKGCIPTRSDGHRLVCCSLYRALLTICRDFTKPTATSRRGTLSSHLQSLVRFRFRHDQDLQSLTRIRDSIRYGRQSLSLLQAARAGSLQAQKQILETLKEVSKLATSISTTKAHCDKDKGDYPAHVQKKRAYIEMVHDPKTYNSPKPGSIPILSRPVPLSQIKSDRRHVPKLVVTQGIPFLQYSDRQPHALSVVLTREIQKGVKRWNHILELDALTQLGHYEDAWDRNVSTFCNVSTEEEARSESNEDDDIVSWSTSAIMAKREILTSVRNDDRKRMALGHKLYKIMLAERALAQKEQQARKDERKASKQEAAKIEARQ